MIKNRRCPTVQCLHSQICEGRCALIVSVEAAGSVCGYEKERFIMKNRNRLFAAVLCALIAGTFLLSGCTGNNENSSSVSSAASQTSVTSEVSEITQTSEKAESSVQLEASDTDETYNSESSTSIKLDGTSAAVTGSGAAAEKGIVRITAAGTYVISGKLSDGQIIIEAGKDDEVKLVLDNADITSTSAPAIYASKCKKTIILLNEGTENSLTDGSSYTSGEDDDAPNAALFVQDDLTILGKGTLNVKGNNNNGITSKDTLKITDGTVNVTAAHHGITGKDDLYISGGTINVNSDSGDGIRSTYSKTDDEKKGNVIIENAVVNIKCAQDGIQAERAVTVSSGTITVETAGGASANETKKSDQVGFMKQETGTETEETVSTRGIKSGTDITVTGGKITVDSYDDALHSNSNVYIKGGEFLINAGDDGIHASDTIEISSGNIVIESSYEGIEAEVVNISGDTVDVTASDDGINCAGGNDQSGFGGMDGNMQFRQYDNNNQAQQNTAQNSNTQEASTQGEMPQGSMQMDVDNNAALNISGGTLYINAQGDGLDSNGSINMTGGTVVVNGTTSGGNGIIDHGADCLVSGGVLIGAGTSDMLEMPDEESTQNTLVVLFDNTNEANTPVYVTDSSGKVIASMSPEKAYGCFIISSPELKNGESYTVYTGGSAGSDGVNGYYADGKASGGTKFVSFTLSDSKVTYVNSDGVTEYSGGMGAGGMGHFGGAGGGMMRNFQ